MGSLVDSLDIRPMQENVESLCLLVNEQVEDLYSNTSVHTCGDGMSSVKKQVKKYRNRLKIRDSKRFAEFGSLPESLFSCFDNSVIVCLLTG